jgi:hypothetical protein
MLMNQEWNSDKLPVYEPGLDDVIRECRGRNLVIFYLISNAMESITKKPLKPRQKPTLAVPGKIHKHYGSPSKLLLDQSPWNLADKFSIPYLILPRSLLS